MATGMLVPAKKPDIDNFSKLILDCLTGILYQDDAQVVDLFCSKRYSENPGVSIRAIPMTHNIKKQGELDELYESDIGEEWS